jgi:hypothetical protein
MAAARTGPVTAREITAAIRGSGVIGAYASLRTRQAGPGRFHVRMPPRTAQSLTADAGGTARMFAARLGVAAEVTAVTAGRSWVTVTVTVDPGRHGP